MSWKKKLPMAATSVRFIVAPIIFIVMLYEFRFSTWIAITLFIFGSFTDWLDGYWARKYHAESNMGRFMDPIADKILVLSVLLILIHLHRIGPAAPAILLARDIFISGIRAIAAADNVIIAAKPTGKWKTGFQMVAIPCLFIENVSILNLDFHQLGTWALWISVILSIISGYDYTIGYFRGTHKK